MHDVYIYLSIFSFLIPFVGWPCVLFFLYIAVSRLLKNKITVSHRYIYYYCLFNSLLHIIYFIGLGHSYQLCPSFFFDCRHLFFIWIIFDDMTIWGGRDGIFSYAGVLRKRRLNWNPCDLRFITSKEENNSLFISILLILSV